MKPNLNPHSNHLTAQEISRHAYHELLTTIEHSPFHRLAFLECIRDIYDLDLLFIGFFDAAGHARAAVPLLGRAFGPIKVWGSPLRKCTMPPATNFCSPDAESKPALSAMEAFIRSRRLRYVQLTTSADHNLDQYAWRFREPLTNLETCLSSQHEDNWRQLSKLPKRCVRKAIKAGVKVHWARNSNILDSQAELVTETYNQQHLPANVPSPIYTRLMKQQTESSCRVLYATMDGRALATIWCFHDTTKCYYWDAAASDEGRRLGANHLLVWCLMRWSVRQGLGCLDFVGTQTGGRNNSRPGIGRFKQSMGAKPIDYTILYYCSWSLRVALNLYRSVSELRRKLTKIKS